MFHYSVYNNIYPILIPYPQSFAISLTSNQWQYDQSRYTNYRNPKRANKPPKKVDKENEAQRTALKEGLQKSLDSSNKGFAILKKMGYEEGKPLGKDGVGITEPLTIAIKNNPNSRAGFGQEVAIRGERAKKPAAVTANKPGVKVVSKKLCVIESPNPPLSRREHLLLKLEANYREDIEILRLRLQAELTSAKSSNNINSLFVAEIASPDSLICGEIFEIIHQYLINSLHVYKCNLFPMFHSIALVDGVIKVVCEDGPSFQYLSDCIKALSERIDSPLKTTRVSPIGSNVYWFGVQMQGIVGGPESFRMQIKKHRYGLKPDRWIIVSQQPCAKTNKTNLQIITEEHSAMLLIYRHSLRLFVCMQEINFTLRGKIPLVE